MTTLLVTLVLVPERSDEVVGRLRGEVAPWVRRLPGFVTSRWLLNDGHDRCLVVLELDGHEAVARLEAALEPGVHDTARSWWCERIEPMSDLGLAARPSIVP